MSFLKIYLAKDQTKAKQPFSRKAAEPRKKNSTTSAVAWLWRDKDGTD